MVEVIREAREPDPRLAGLLKRLGGLNYFGEPNFIIFWGQTRTIPTGFGPMLQGFGLPAWFLAQWHPPTDYGSPATWDYAIAGPYPCRGGYEVVQAFYRRWSDGRFESMPMNDRTIEALVPLILRYRSDDARHRLEVLKEDRERNWKVVEDKIADRLQDSVPLGEIISYRLQGSSHSALRQRMMKIEQDAKWFRAMPSGMAAINPLQAGMPLPKRLQGRV